jgi:pentose-5-phosphate-3-epimerase
MPKKTIDVHLMIVDPDKLYYQNICSIGTNMPKHGHSAKRVHYYRTLQTEAEGMK